MLPFYSSTVRPGDLCRGSLKANVSALKVQEQARQSALDEAQQRLRDSQDALEGVQDQLNAMTKKLNPGEH